jgi:hypothetical protein
MKFSLSEVINMATDMSKSNDRRREVLLKNDSVGLRKILDLACNYYNRWDLPEGDPPYKPSEFSDSQNMLLQHLRRLPMFMKTDGPPIVKDKRRREQLFIELLESIHEDDAKLLLACKSGELRNKLNKTFINNTFPGLIWAPAPYEDKESSTSE